MRQLSNIDDGSTSDTLAEKVRRLLILSISCSCRSYCYFSPTDGSSFGVWWAKAKTWQKKHSWGRCVHVRSCLNHFKQHNTLARPCAVDLISRPQPLWKESLIDFFRGLRGHGASFFTVAAMGSDDCVLSPFDSIASFHRAGTSGASGRCIGGVISGERTRRSRTRLTLTSCKCWRALRWAGNRGKADGNSLREPLPATTTVPVFMQEIINYWSQPLKASFSDGIQEKLVCVRRYFGLVRCPCAGCQTGLGVD